MIIFARAAAASICLLAFSGMEIRAQGAYGPMGHPWYDSLSSSQRKQVIGSFYTTESVAFCVPSTSEKDLELMHVQMGTDIDFVRWFRKMNTNLGSQIVSWTEMLGGCDAVRKGMADAVRRRDAIRSR